MIDIYFGNVVDVADDEKLNRVKVQIKGFTDTIPVDDLPWYYPFFGQNYLPIKNDIVPVIIFNNDFTNGFYNHKVDVNVPNLYDTEYENYLEIYKRLGVELTYTESKGILLKNKDAKITIEEDKIEIITKKGIGLTIENDGGIVIESMDQDIQINSKNSRVILDNTGVRIKTDKKINLGGKFEGLYNLIPGMPIADVSQIGVSKKVTLS